ncbi:RagB/SusD family nutrient uptake outer membrane protein [Olivibacter sitiensis]|uniref:RagB/SusD family nutrient uptake outer membrane protein n=1 Tax=Olivibacter sitiensis TaxID=376470 RepID=UPI0005622B68|nr:RagB/SusD family nutrient uptake outer membrane protein [Olivibacter sitiensis]
MKRFVKSIFWLAILICSALFSGCEMDTVNPNNPTDAEVLSTQEGIVALSIGVRQFYATSGIEALYLYQGVTGRETKGIATFTNVLELGAGGSAIPNNNSSILNLWLRMQRIMSMSEDIVEYAPQISGIDPALLSGIVAHAKLFKAMALGGLATAFEQANLATSTTENVTFVPRQQVLEEAVRLLDEAISSVAATPPSGAFTTLVAGSSFDLQNVLYAYSARYNLMAGNYQAALDRANQVNLSGRSEFEYNTQSINPIWDYLVTQNYYKPRAGFGLPAGLFYEDDQRLSFYMGGEDVVVDGDVIKSINGFFTEQMSSIPVFLPDEMKLIKAEAILRNNGEITEALALINEVRTQTSGDVFGVYAGLPPYSGDITQEALLLEVYRQRCAELYLTGQKVEDSRRFGRPGPPTSTEERNRNFYPYPDQERLNNPNTPADPEI